MLWEKAQFSSVLVCHPNNAFASRIYEFNKLWAYAHHDAKVLVRNLQLLFV